MQETNWHLLSETELKSIDWFEANLDLRDWDINRSPGFWTDLCRAIERWVVYQLRLEESK